MNGFGCVMSGIAVIGLATASHAATIFSADFNASTEIVGAVTDNADVTNLDAGTGMGSWALSGSGGGNPGAIIDNAASDNNAFVFDQGVSGNPADRATGLFTDVVDLDMGEGVRVEFDIYASRQGNNKQVRLGLQGPGGSGEQVYVLIFNQSTTKSFGWLNTSNSIVTATTSTGINSGFANPTDGSYLSWGSGVPIHVELTALPGTTINAATTGGLLTVDWDSDGVIEAGDGDVANVPIGPRTAGRTDIDRFELFYGGTSGNRGAYVDNFNATTIPEPSNMMLGGLLSLIGVAGVLRYRWR